MYDLVAQFKQMDPRHLYAQATNQMHWNPSLAEGDEFFEGTVLKDQAGKPLPLRGSYWIGDWVTGHIDNRPPSTMVDYHESIAGVPVPVVAHEMAEFEVAPDFSEIPEYTGVTRARNLEIFRQRLADANMLDQADDFVRASGALSILCHREDIEAELRTPGMGGFHLLDIQDFSGQGTALVGILNAFMESKGLITPAQWREFCCEVVPLLRMEKYTWTTDECFVGRVQVAQYSAADLDAAKVDWAVRDAAGRRVAGGSFAPENIKQGNVREVGMFCFPLAKVAAPGKLTITLSIEATPYRNRYEIWVYPPKVDTKVPAGVCRRPQARRRRVGPAGQGRDRPAAAGPEHDRRSRQVHRRGVRVGLLVLAHVRTRGQAEGHRARARHAGVHLRSQHPGPGELPDRVPQQLAVVAARQALPADHSGRRAG